MAHINYATEQFEKKIVPQLRAILIWRLHLQNRQVKHKVLTSSWVNGGCESNDLCGNTFTFPMIVMNREDGSYEYITYHGDEVRLNSQNGYEGSWNVDAEGNILG